uniref:Uncharacterized protein n=1 Tax=Schizaphis graminum TaxID=13262 RepID=A0A2S2NQN3_SCHGA
MAYKRTVQKINSKQFKNLLTLYELTNNDSKDIKWDDKIKIVYPTSNFINTLIDQFQNNTVPYNCWSYIKENKIKDAVDYINMIKFVLNITNISNLNMVMYRDSCGIVNCINNLKKNIYFIY